MSFHGVQLLGIAVLGFGIYLEMTYQNLNSQYTNFMPSLGLVLILAGLFLDPFIEARYIKK